MGVYVVGLRETTRAMERAGADIEDLKDVMGEIATEATDTMRPHIPEKSGRLRATARPNRAKGKAVVTVGTARVSYAGVVRGWAARRGKDFVQRTDEVMDDRIPLILARGWETIAERHGLL